MEICYEITRGDFLAFQKYAYKHARDKKMRLFMYVFFAALAAYFSLFNFDVPLVVRAVWFLLNLGTLLLISAF